MKRILLLIILIPFYHGSQAQYLEPNDNIFDASTYGLDYHLKLREKFEFNSDEYCILRMIATPSFSPEFLFEIRKTDSTYTLILKKALNNIWYAKENYKQVKMKSYSSKISIKDVKLLFDLYLINIRKTSYPIYDVSVYDGTSYYFSVDDHGIKSGHASSPSDTILRSMIKITESLIKQTEKGKTTVKFSSKEIAHIEDLILKGNAQPGIEDYKLFYEINKFLIENKDTFEKDLIVEEYKSFEESIIELQKGLNKLLLSGFFKKQEIISYINYTNYMFLDRIDLISEFINKKEDTDRINSITSRNLFTELKQYIK